jgi:hypothetical protein
MKKERVNQYYNMQQFSKTNEAVMVLSEASELTLIIDVTISPLTLSRMLYFCQDIIATLNMQHNCHDGACQVKKKICSG